jgi:hypothetical protein
MSDPSKGNGVSIAMGDAHNKLKEGGGAGDIHSRADKTLEMGKGQCVLRTWFQKRIPNSVHRPLWLPKGPKWH